MGLFLTWQILTSLTLLYFISIIQVTFIRNSLAHLKHDNNLSIDDPTFNGYFKDITDLVDSIQGLGRPYFTQQTAEDLHKKLHEVFIVMLSGKNMNILAFIRKLVNIKKK